MLTFLLTFLLSQSLKSRGYVTEKFSWQYYYWYLTNDGMHLPTIIYEAILGSVVVIFACYSCHFSWFKVSHISEITFIFPLRLFQLPFADRPGQKLLDPDLKVLSFKIFYNHLDFRDCLISFCVETIRQSFVNRFDTMLSFHFTLPAGMLFTQSERKIEPDLRLCWMRIFHFIPTPPPPPLPQKENYANNHYANNLV